MVNPQPPLSGASNDLWQERRLRDLKGAGVREGEGYLYQPGEVLVAVQDEERLGPALRDVGGWPDEGNVELDRVGLSLHRWYVDTSVDLPSLLRELRYRPDLLRREDADQPPLIALNHVLSGEGPYHGGPGGPPRASDAMTRVEVEPSTEAPVLAVLDTGLSVDADALHPDLVQMIAVPAGSDELDLDGFPGLDTEAGHGTFICGLVQRLVAGLTMEVRQVLSPSGWGCDRDIALALARQKCPVVNLSLGGYTEDDRPPPALQDALRLLGRERVVVAAAGNNGSERPFWPAAFKQVVAVAALDTTGPAPAEAAFSNRGDWVDVCAPGVDLHAAFVRGKQDAGAGPQVFQGWACWSGTSFAAPLVAAAIARAVAAGTSPRVATAVLLASLSTLPGLEDFGVWYDPGGVDLVCRPS